MKRFEEKELEILRKAVDKAETTAGRELLHSENIQEIIQNLQMNLVISITPKLQILLINCTIGTKIIVDLFLMIKYSMIGKNLILGNKKI